MTDCDWCAHEATTEPRRARLRALELPVHFTTGDRVAIVVEDSRARFLAAAALHALLFAWWA